MAARMRPASSVELNDARYERVFVDGSPNLSRNIRCNGLEIVRILHVGPNSLSHQFGPSFASEATPRFRPTALKSWVVLWQSIWICPTGFIEKWICQIVEYILKFLLDALNRYFGKPGIACFTNMPVDCMTKHMHYVRFAELPQFCLSVERAVRSDEISYHSWEEILQISHWRGSVLTGANSNKLLSPT